MLFTSSVPQAALRGGWRIRREMPSDTQHNRGVERREYYTVHFTTATHGEQINRGGWGELQILIGCLGAVIKKNDYIFPEMYEKVNGPLGQCKAALV